MADKNRATFAPLPVRAIGDQRLTASHFRALGAIGEHDRMSGHRGKGAGCYASNKTLSEKCGINYSNFSTVIRQLGSWGYIVSAPHPINKRTRVYRVIYDEADLDNGLPTGKPSHDLTTADSLPTGKASSESDGHGGEIQPAESDPLPTGEQSAEVLCPPTHQVAEITQQPNDKYIPYKREDITQKRERDSAEAAPLPSGERLGSKNETNQGKFLAMAERELQAGNCTLDNATRQAIEEILESTSCDDPLYHQAERILDAWESEP